VLPEAERLQLKQRARERGLRIALAALPPAEEGVCTHEAGHAVMACVEGLPIKSVDVLHGTLAGQAVDGTCDGGDLLSSVDARSAAGCLRLEAHARFYVAGLAAERLKSGGREELAAERASSDLEHLRTLFAWLKDAGRATCGFEAWLEARLEEAEGSLRGRWPEVLAVAEALRDRRWLGGGEVKQIVGAAPAAAKGASKMETKRKSFETLGLKTDAPQGLVECYVSVFNVIDRAGERILPGFFEESLKHKLPVGCWSHDWSQPVAKTLVCEERLAGDRRLPSEIRRYGGLYVKAQFNLGTTRGADAFSDLQFGTFSEFSIGYSVQRTRWNPTDGCLDLVEGELFEWSPVLAGCNPATVLVDAKAAGRLPDSSGFNLERMRLKQKARGRNLQVIGAAPLGLDELREKARKREVAVRTLAGGRR
jgi:HK97 family phage prohead protease